MRISYSFLAFVLLVFLPRSHAYEGKLVSLAVGGKLSNDIVRRGARIYDGFQASPVLYLGLFDERVQFFINSLEVNDFVLADTLRARSKIAMVNDRPFLKTAGELAARNSRESTWEWINMVECFIPDRVRYWGQIDLRYARDLKAHSGNYLETTARVTLGKFWLEGEKPRIQPQLFATVGWGDASHNGYLYGAGATASGFNHVAYGIMVISPARIDAHFPVLQIYRYDVLGDTNRGGSLVPQHGGYHVDVSFAFGLL